MKMRFDNSIKKCEINYLNEKQKLNYNPYEQKMGTCDMQENAKMAPEGESTLQERSRYIHRCPFTHCHHNHSLCNSSLENQSHAIEDQPHGIKVPLNSLHAFPSCKNNDQNDIKQSHFIHRGTTTIQAVVHNLTPAYRQRAITYMLNRMGGGNNSDPALQHRLLVSIMTLEQQVFVVSQSKDKYMENLALKLFLIFQELDRRREIVADELTKDENK